ncbi:hypothetical protein KAU11_06120, partial [Candidatus Babeliales bacterium]|nr:hypothetical protein [Candidatus Babeliales bacterium]
YIYSYHKRAARTLILGLTYKPDVGDMRESPAFEIATYLNNVKKICNLKVCDPYVVGSKFKEFCFFATADWEKQLKWAEIVMLLVPHKIFCSLSYAMLSKKYIVDPTGFLSKKKRTPGLIKEREHEAGLCF